MCTDVRSVSGVAMMRSQDHNKGNRPTRAQYHVLGITHANVETTKLPPLTILKSS